MQKCWKRGGTFYISYASKSLLSYGLQPLPIHLGTYIFFHQFYICYAGKILPISDSRIGTAPQIETMFMTTIFVCRN